MNTDTMIGITVICCLVVSGFTIKAYNDGMRGEELLGFVMLRMAITAALVAFIVVCGAVVLLLGGLFLLLAFVMAGDGEEYTGVKTHHRFDFDFC